MTEAPAGRVCLMLWPLPDGSWRTLIWSCDGMGETRVHGDVVVMDEPTKEEAEALAWWWYEQVGPFL